MRKHSILNYVHADSTIEKRSKANTYDFLSERTAGITSSKQPNSSLPLLSRHLLPPSSTSFAARAHLLYCPGRFVRANALSVQSNGPCPMTCFRTLTNKSRIYCTYTRAHTTNTRGAKGMNDFSYINAAWVMCLEWDWEIWENIFTTCYPAGWSRLFSFSFFFSFWTAAPVRLSPYEEKYLNVDGK